MVGLLTWWNGATFGTWFATVRSGKQVGDDTLGNRYFEARKPGDGRMRRWVIYNGANDASRVPPEWHGWLHHSIEALPDVGLPPVRRWEKEALANATGTPLAYRPAGASGMRAAATGDYEPWTPDQ